VKNTLPYLVNLPPFLYRGKNVDEFNIIQKIIFLIYGKLISIIVNNTNRKFFCFLINLLVKDSKISYKDEKYVSKFNNQSIYFPNKRVLRFVNKPELLVNKTFEAYCLDQIKFKDSDTVIDCGANVGEVNIALKYNGININYVGFEPDESTFECLKLNNQGNKFYKIALSNEDQNQEFFLDNEGGNSSLVNFGTKNSINVEAKRLDSYNFKNIKLLKIDAEGFEPEVLDGSTETLKNTEYVSVDFGSERGIEQSNTVVDVNKKLYSNGFSLYRFSEVRLIGLYKRI